MFSHNNLQKKNRVRVRVLLFTLMFILSMSLTSTAFARDADDVKDELQDAKSEEQQAKAELQKIKDNIAALERKITDTQNEIATTDTKIEENTATAERLAEELVALEAELEGEEENLNARLRVMYQSKEESIIVILLSSSNIVDFFANLEMVQLIHKSGEELIEELDTKLGAVEEKKVAIENIQIELVEQKTAQEQRKADLEEDNKALDSEREKAETNVAAAVEHTKALEAESAVIEAELAALAEQQRQEAARKEAERAAKEAEKAAREAERQAQLEREEAERQAAIDAGEEPPEPAPLPPPIEVDDNNDTGFVYTGGTMNWPAQGRLTSGFGPRWGTIHQGIDIANSAGTPIYAAAEGTVIYSQWNSGGYGYQVRIDHGGGIVTTYAHNSSLVARVGQKVSRGDLIAKMGTTGDSTGNHCHFEVRVNGKAQNPMNWL